MLSTIAQVLFIWFGVATVAALSLGAILGSLSAAPMLAPIPIRDRRPGDVAREESGYHVGCGAGR